MIQTTLFATMILITSAMQPPAKPSSPIVEAPPVWSRTLRMPDGRTLVSDGALAIDAAIAKPAALPKTLIDVKPTNPFAQYIEGPFKTEIGLAELRAGERKNTFVGPDDIGLNGNYVTFLRKAAPRARLRFNGPGEPIQIRLDNKSVGVVMPLAPAR